MFQSLVGLCSAASGLVGAVCCKDCLACCRSVAEPAGIVCWMVRGGWMWVVPHQLVAFPDLLEHVGPSCTPSGVGWVDDSCVGCGATLGACPAAWGVAETDPVVRKILCVAFVVLFFGRLFVVRVERTAHCWFGRLLVPRPPWVEW